MCSTSSIGGRRDAVMPSVGMDTSPRKALAVAGPATPASPSQKGISRAGVNRRSPRTTYRLGRLRAELQKISPRPCDPQQARDQIAKAMARAGLDGWSLPTFDDDATLHFPDGSCGIALIAHCIIFNAWGAFRIIDIHSPAVPYFEMSGCKGQAFRMPE